MKVTYHPAGQDEPTVYQFDVEDTMESRLEAIEKQYAKLSGNPAGSIDVMLLGVMQGQATARRVLLWHLRDQDHPGKVRVEDVDFRRRDLVVEASRSDLVWLRSKFVATAGISEADRKQLLDGIDAQIAEIDAAASVVDGEVGKALSPSSDDATG